jgi:hypothetical protein
MSVMCFIAHNPNNYGRALMSAFPQAIAPNPHTEVEVTLRLTVSQSVRQTVRQSVSQSLSQSVSMSWYRVPLWDFRPDIISCRNVAL